MTTSASFERSSLILTGLLVAWETPKFWRVNTISEKKRAREKRETVRLHE